MRNQPLAWAVFTLFTSVWPACRPAEKAEPLPEQYRRSGAFIKSLPYFNPDSCAVVIRRDVARRWQGAAYENLFLDGPEDSPVKLALRHLDCYERNFPADSARAFAQLNRGLICIFTGKADSARLLLEDSYAISQRIKSPLRAADALSNLATLHYKNGKTNEAIRSYLAYYQTVEGLDSTQNYRKAIAIHGLDAAFHQSGNTREALRWTQTGIALTANENVEANRNLKVDFLRDAGVMYNTLGLPDSAIMMHQLALQVQEKYGTINDRSMLLHYLSVALLNKGECPAALENELAAQRLSKHGNPANDSEMNLNFGLAYSCLGKADSAQIFYEKVVNKSPYPKQVAIAQGKLGLIYAQKGRWQAAYEEMRAASETQEKNFNTEKVLELGALKSQMEIEHTKHVLERASAKARIVKQQLWIAGLSLLLLATIAMVLFSRNKALSRQLSLKDEFIKQLGLKSTNGTDLSADLGDPRSLRILTRSDWSRFLVLFEQEFPNFLNNLKADFPELTAADTRLFLLIKLSLDNREICEALGISLESVHRSRNRLRRKLGLTQAQGLDDYIQRFSKVGS